MARALAAALMLTLAGCLTALSGTDQAIAVVSDPPGATASAGGERCRTPCRLRLSRGDAPPVEVALPGHATARVPMTRHLGGRVVFAYLPVGVALAAIPPLLTTDFASGAVWRLEPERIEVRLIPEGSTEPAVTGQRSLVEPEVAPPRSIVRPWCSYGVGVSGLFAQAAAFDAGVQLDLQRLSMGLDGGVRAAWDLRGTSLGGSIGWNLGGPWRLRNELSAEGGVIQMRVVADDRTYLERRELVSRRPEATRPYAGLRLTTTWRGGPRDWLVLGASLFVRTTLGSAPEERYTVRTCPFWGPCTEASREVTLGGLWLGAGLVVGTQLRP